VVRAAVAPQARADGGPASSGAGRSSRRRFRISRTVAGSFVLAPLLGLAALSIPRGAADALALGPYLRLVHEARGVPGPAGEEWIRGRDRLRQAIALDPHNPNFRETLARWYESSARRMRADNPVQDAYFRQALVHMRSAIAARPASSYTWANLALIKTQIGERDTELDRAVANAARLGPWEPEVQLALADVLFIAGERLQPETRAAAIQLVSNALKRQTDKLAERAVRFGKLSLLCTVPGVERSAVALRCI
jgi:predicted Zn-dependent protease